jgi:hypothetical protein
MGVCYHRGPAFVEHGGTLFFRAFEVKGHIKKYVKMRCLHMGPVGEPGWDSLAGTF